MPVQSIRVNMYRLLQGAVQQGAAYGVMRALKYMDDYKLTDVQEDQIVESVVEHVMSELSETVDMSDAVDWEEERFRELYQKMKSEEQSYENRLSKSAGTSESGNSADSEAPF